MSKDQLDIRTRERLDERREHLKQDAAAGLIGLLLKGGEVFLEGQALENQAANGWEETKQRLALIDAESEAELRKLQECLHGAKEKTQRLSMVLGFAAQNPGLHPAIAEGIAKAVDNLTREL